MTRSLLAVCGVLLVAAVFQLFLRYQYIHTAGLAVMRIDRISGSSCYMPCLPAPSPTPAPASPVPTPEPTFDANAFQAAIATANEDAIALVKSLPNVYASIAAAKPNSKWSAKEANAGSDDQFFAALDTLDKHPPGVAVTPAPVRIDRVRLVSYADAKGFGFYWEVHLDTKRLYFVNDDAALSKKYLAH